MPSPGDLPNTAIEPTCLTSATWEGGFFTTSTNWKPSSHIMRSILIGPVWDASENFLVEWNVSIGIQEALEYVKISKNQLLQKINKNTGKNVKITVDLFGIVNVRRKWNGIFNVLKTFLNIEFYI